MLNAFSFSFAMHVGLQTFLNMIKKDTTPPQPDDGKSQILADAVETGSKSRETRERILNAALELFRVKGYDETTMREIAREAGVATGAAYYYFRAKEDLVMAFYLRTAEDTRRDLPAALAGTKDLRKRLHIIIEQKLDQFSDHRRFLGALFRTAIDPQSPLSPFAPETLKIREEAIGWFQQALDGSTVKVPKEFTSQLPRLLWLYQMGILLHWNYDRSPGQQRTHKLVNGSIDLMIQGLRLSALPLLGPIRRKAAALLREMDLVDRGKFERMEDIDEP